jgi:hypothetical protein
MHDDNMFMMRSVHVVPEYPPRRTFQIIINDKEEWDTEIKEFSISQTAPKQTQELVRESMVKVSLALGRNPT